jgi:hypothetical protein
MSVRFVYKSNMHMDVGVTDQNGDPVTNATIAMTIIDRWRQVEADSGVSWPVAPAHQGAGVYRYTTTLALANAMVLGRWYAQITATVGSVQRYALVPIYVLQDQD